MKYLNNKKGETLVETLCAMLIIVIVITGFAEVISVLAKANATIRDSRTTYNYDYNSGDASTSGVSKVTGTISIDGKAYKAEKYTIYKDKANGLYYYEYDYPKH